MTHAYSLYGLSVRSELALPELHRLSEGDWVDRPDVTVRLGRSDVPAGSSEDICLLPNGAGFRVPGVGSYSVAGGREIIVDPAAGAVEANVRLYLLGSAMGLLLHQRGVLPLHANAIDIDGTAFAFMGPPGAGKSTLAAYFNQYGARVLADDVCAVTLGSDGWAWIGPGLPRVRLWRNTLAALELEPGDYPRSYAGDPGYDKFDVPLRPVQQKARQLGGVFILVSGDAPGIRSLGGAAAMNALVENIYRGSWAAVTGSLDRHWRRCLEIASSTPVFELEIQRDLAALPELVARMATFCRGLLDERIAKEGAGH
ncbi:hypothetical protein [Sphingomonas arenae]|uniref:hypothetical protein n=1 Tax=Sphingomonas arenae TaxID=2812555 RepID=UPI001967A076|nr:hypothetical protein [Sphingomonas arenae]